VSAIRIKIIFTKRCKIALYADLCIPFKKILRGINKSAQSAILHLCVKII